MMPRDNNQAAKNVQYVSWTVKLIKFVRPKKTFNWNVEEDKIYVKAANND